MPSLVFEDLKFKMAQIKIEVFLALHCWLSQLIGIQTSNFDQRWWGRIPSLTSILIAVIHVYLEKPDWFGFHLILIDTFERIPNWNWLLNVCEWIKTIGILDEFHNCLPIGKEFSQFLTLSPSSCSYWMDLKVRKSRKQIMVSIFVAFTE